VHVNSSLELQWTGAMLTLDQKQISASADQTIVNFVALADAGYCSVFTWASKVLNGTMIEDMLLTFGWVMLPAGSYACESCP
jgi:hypothetical protein